MYYFQLLIVNNRFKYFLLYCYRMLLFTILFHYVVYIRIQLIFIYLMGRQLVLIPLLCSLLHMTNRSISIFLFYIYILYIHS